MGTGGENNSAWIIFRFLSDMYISANLRTNQSFSSINLFQIYTILWLQSFGGVQIYQILKFRMKLNVCDWKVHTYFMYFVYNWFIAICD